MIDELTELNNILADGHAYTTIQDYDTPNALLSLLDGENQINNIVHIATTNYPDKLGARIVNRPSRFDIGVDIGFSN